jgi:hypothetical protein
MLKLNKYITKYFLFAVWFLLAALLADNVNLVDYIRGSNVIHTDEPESPQLDEENDFQLTPQKALNQLLQNPNQSLNNFSKPIYDQDSPFLEASTLKKFSNFLFETNECQETIRSFFLIRQLYIHLCSLLI